MLKYVYSIRTSIPREPHPLLRGLWFQSGFGADPERFKYRATVDLGQSRIVNHHVGTLVRLRVMTHEGNKHKYDLSADASLGKYK